MSRSQSLLVLDDGCDPGGLAREDLAPYDTLVLLFWASTGTLRRLGEICSARLVTLEEVVGGHERWEREALRLTDAVCRSGPRHRAAPVRELLAEALYGEALIVQAVLDTLEWARRAAPPERLAARIDLRTRPSLARLFAALLAGSGGADLALREIPALRSDGGSPSRLGRLVRRIRHARLTGGWRGQLSNLLSQLDARYALRCRVQRHRSEPALDPGGITFLSSYLNNSRILSAFEDLMPRPVHWVVTNHYARLAAGSGGHPASWLWQFAPRDASIPLPSHDAPPRGDPTLTPWLAWSPAWRYWSRAGRVSLARLTACWERYLEAARPSLVVTASQWGLEGCLMRVARARGVPVLQLLHGVLAGIFHTRRPVESDALVVWGPFWRELFPPRERPRIHVVHPGGAVVRAPRKEPSRPPRLTFFSWPLDRLPFYNQGELQDGLVDLLHELAGGGRCSLTLRAHPLENPADLLGRWKERHGRVPPGVRLSQHEPLRGVIEQTDVAVMFRSTVLLDCLDSATPVVMIGWVPSGWGSRLEGLSGLHLAADPDDLRATLMAWLDRPPVIDPGVRRRFLSDAERRAADLDRLLHRLSRPRPDH